MMRPRDRDRPNSRAWSKAVGLTLLLNLAFFGLNLTTNLLPREVLLSRVQDAFETGDLLERDYLSYDSRRGSHQYNDCNILQMLTNRDAAPVQRALGPRFFSAADGASCRTLRQLTATASEEGRPLASARYTRYWHGYLPAVGALLTQVNLRAARGVLRLAVYGAALCLLIAGLRRPRFLPLAGSIAVCALLFWSLPYFGPGLSHAPGDLAVLLGLGALVLASSHLSRRAVMLPACAAYGAIVVYFEMLTGQLPTAAGFLFPTAYLISRSGSDDGRGWRDDLGFATQALAAFAAGAALSVATKLGLAAALVEPSGLDAFLGNLRLYTRPIDTDLPIPTILQPIGRVVYKGTALTYGSAELAVALYASCAGAWLAAGWLAWRSERRRLGADLAAFAVGAASVPAWSLLLQTHTFVHAGFMTRMLIVPISLGWAAALWQWRARLERGGRGEERRGIGLREGPGGPGAGGGPLSSPP